MATTEPLTCELCYHPGLDVKRGLAWYEDSREPCQFIDRCVDHVGCRSRVEATAERWPLADRVPA